MRVVLGDDFHPFVAQRPVALDEHLEFLLRDHQLVDLAIVFAAHRQHLKQLPTLGRQPPHHRAHVLADIAPGDDRVALDPHVAASQEVSKLQNFRCIGDALPGSSQSDVHLVVAGIQ